MTKRKNKNESQKQKSDFKIKQEITIFCEKFNDYIKFKHLFNLYEKYGINDGSKSIIHSIFEYNGFIYNLEKEIWETNKISEEEFYKEYLDSSHYNTAYYKQEYVKSIKEFIKSKKIIFNEKKPQK